MPLVLFPFLLWLAFFYVLLAFLFFWGVSILLLRGENLSKYDLPRIPDMAAGIPPSPEHRQVVASLGKLRRLLVGVPPAKHVYVLRDHMDALFDHVEHTTTFTSVELDGIAGEWVTLPESDPGIRTLYLHGGSFTLGSARSHRTITSKLAEITGGAVLAIDYRRMPEHSRLACLEDARRAYVTLLQQGPAGAGPARKIVVAGDSAGANVALALLAWIRDKRHRRPDAAVALSPLTDCCFMSPSLRQNLRTDPMLGPALQALAYLPRIWLWWLYWMRFRVRPCSPAVSPIYGNLAGLPPLLIQASSAEMLVDDARRYANKAVAQGSPVQLQTWAHMVHVWQIYHHELPEGRAAFEEIGRFLRSAIR